MTVVTSRDYVVERLATRLERQSSAPPSSDVSPPPAGASTAAHVATILVRILAIMMLVPAVIAIPVFLWNVARHGDLRGGWQLYGVGFLSFGIVVVPALLLLRFSRSVGRWLARGL